jgi:lysophospholipase L1-like esterase
MIIAFLLLSVCTAIGSSRVIRNPYLPQNYIDSLSSSSSADPCGNATHLECGGSNRPFCSFACVWNSTSEGCESIDNYPIPGNLSLVELVSSTSPLLLENANYTTISFYGDSITWLNVYEPVITDAISSSPFTKNVPIRVINQGVNGGTIKDLVKGFSPWGHLNPHLPQSNISFVQTLDEDNPDIVHIQIGINDVLQAGSSCGDRCSNVSEYMQVFRDEIAAPLQERNITFVIISVSTIGELPYDQNPNDADLDAFASAQRELASEFNVPFVNLRSVDEMYESLNNCLPLINGLITYDGIHPNEPRGSINLANLHSQGLLQALIKSNLKPKPAPFPYAGRIFITSNAYSLNLGGISGADEKCTLEAKEPAKALLVDEDGCNGPCRRASQSPYLGDGQIDWPLKPRSSYYRFDGNSSVVGFTDENALIQFPFWGPLFSCFNQISGFHTDWTTKKNQTCDSWTQGTSSAAQGVGWACDLENSFLDGGNLDCSSPNKFVCVTMS